jgi:hypothetical protein
MIRFPLTSTTWAPLSMGIDRCAAAPLDQHGCDLGRASNHAWQILTARMARVVAMTAAIHVHLVPQA